jgi:hypothetical protein
MSRYAENTEVSVERSRGEIERILGRWGASHFLYASSENASVIAFQYKDKQIKFSLPLPNRKDQAFWYTAARHRQRSAEAAFKLWEQACRQRWRALALSIKAKLESVDSGIETFEGAFLPYVVLPDGKTVSELVLPALAQNRLPALTFN